MLDAHQLLWTQIAAGVCLLIFAALLFSLVRHRGRMEAAQGWTRTEGVITASKVDQPPEHFSDDLNDAKPIVRYRYRVGGQDFDGDRIAIGGQALTTRVLAGRLAGRYPVGAHVDVYVDPGNPSESVLEPAEPQTLAGLVAFTLVFGIIAAVLVAHAIAGRVLTTGKGVPLFAFILPIVALIGAVIGVIAFVRRRQLASASLRWPTVAGTIVASDVIEELVEDKRYDDKRDVRKIPRFQVDLRYAYKVGKRDFVGVAANWGDTAMYGLRELADKAAGRYRPGQPVTVYYDPQRPGHAVLEPDSREGSLAPLILAAICAAIGGVFLAFFLTIGFG